VRSESRKDSLVIDFETINIRVDTGEYVVASGSGSIIVAKSLTLARAYAYGSPRVVGEKSIRGALRFIRSEKKQNKINKK
jgi:hypothetical protein